MRGTLVPGVCPKPCTFLGLGVDNLLPYFRIPIEKRQTSRLLLLTTTGPVGVVKCSLGTSLS